MQDFRTGLLNAAVATFNKKEDVWETTVEGLPFKFWLDFEEDTVILRIVGPSPLDRYLFFSALLICSCAVFKFDRSGGENGWFFKSPTLLSDEKLKEAYKNSAIIIYDASFEDFVYIPGFPEYFEKRLEACKGKVNPHYEALKKRWQETGQYEAMRDKQIHDDQVAETEREWEEWEKQQDDSSL